MLRETNPKHWKFLIFYFNPSEPRLLVQKRSGLPFTLNFARPAAWAITGTTLAIATIFAIRNS
ncbi:MAG: DUF5808 domain-containing protein [Terriglobales bacterium]